MRRHCWPPREREGRLYSDPAVAVLPNVPASDPLRSEWLQRSDSTGRLVAALVMVVEIGFLSVITAAITSAFVESASVLS